MLPYDQFKESKFGIHKTPVRVKIFKSIEPKKIVSLIFGQKIIVFNKKKPLYFGGKL